MTIKDCIDIVDNNKPNQYTIKEKVMWLSFIEQIIINEVLKTHEGYDGRYDDFEGYSEEKLSVTLIVPFPYDKLYPEYLKMMIDKENGETQRYNNSARSYNTYMTEYRKYYNKTHMPIDKTSRRAMPLPHKATVGLSDAEYENLKKDMTYILTEYFSGSVSPDKLYDAVTKYAQNNLEMLKGKPGKEGYTPQKSIDYWTDADIKEIHSYIDEQTMVLEADVEGIKNNINREAHFRGYLLTNDKIKSLPATPNDFAYSGESGTKWVYEADGWKDSGIEVPNQPTPPSDDLPLMDGKASAGTSNEYSRSDHRHKSDTTKVNVTEFNEFKAEVEEGLEHRPDFSALDGVEFRLEDKIEQLGYKIDDRIGYKEISISYAIDELPTISEAIDLGFNIYTTPGMHHIKLTDVYGKISTGILVIDDLNGAVVQTLILGYLIYARLRSNSGRWSRWSLQSMTRSEINEYVDEKIGDIESALDELHTYAQSLIDGGA